VQLYCSGILLLTHDSTQFIAKSYILASSVYNERYSRNAPCALNLISTMAIIFSVLRLVFLYLWPLCCIVHDIIYITSSIVPPYGWRWTMIHKTLPRKLGKIKHYDFHWNCSWREVLDTTLCDKVSHWLTAGRWFSPNTLVSSTNKTNHHDITEILLKIALEWIIVHRHYIVSPSPRFSLFMAIILSVLRLVFPYLWPLYCLSFISFFLIKDYN
jgi:hypothetical protein